MDKRVVLQNDGGSLVRTMSCGLMVLALGMAPSAPAARIGHWSLDGNANDSANGNNGTLVGDATYVAGKYGQAATFDGIGDYISVPDGAAVHDTAFSAFTAMAWIKPVAGGEYDSLMGKMGGAGDRGWDIWVNRNLGKRGTAGSATWTGEIDDVKIFNETLSASEIQFAASPPAVADNDELRVVRYGDNTFIRSVFSVTQDLVLRVGLGANNQISFGSARLVANSAGMTEGDLDGGILIHNTGDDAAPWRINNTYIGASHGCSDARKLMIAGHGLTATDLGSEWEDGSGRKYYIIKIVDANNVWVLSENMGTGARWDFDNTISGTVLTNKAASISFAFSGNSLAQIIPACRMATQSWLVNGEIPLANGIVATCDTFDIVEEYDMVNPASLLADIIANPGEERDFTAAHLDGVVRNEITYRFHPNGANMIYYNATALQELELTYMGFLQTTMLTKGTYDTHEYYIPKTIPFTQDAIDYDFKMRQDFTFALPNTLNFTDDKIEDPQNRPERYIQLLGDVAGGVTNRQVGYAIGYSPVHGLTQPQQRAANIDNALFLNKSSKKSYPHALDSAMGSIVPAGAEFYCLGYRHYMNLEGLENATCVYWQEQEDDWVVYMDYHKSVDHDVVQLPAEFAGRQIEIIDKTSSLTLDAQTVGQDGGVSVSVTGGYGYAVFRLSAATGLSSC